MSGIQNKARAEVLHLLIETAEQDLKNHRPSFIDYDELKEFIERDTGKTLCELYGHTHTSKPWGRGGRVIYCWRCGKTANLFPKNPKKRPEKKLKKNRLSG